MKNNVLNIFKLIFEKVKKYIHICVKVQYIMADNGEAGANRQKDKYFEQNLSTLPEFYK